MEAERFSAIDGNGEDMESYFVRSREAQEKFLMAAKGIKENPRPPLRKTSSTSL